MSTPYRCGAEEARVELPFGVTPTRSSDRNGLPVFAPRGSHRVFAPEGLIEYSYNLPGLQNQVVICWTLKGVRRLKGLPVKLDVKGSTTLAGVAQRKSA